MSPANDQFAVPPLASGLLLTGFALPILFDAGSFAASAVLVFGIAALPRSKPDPADRRPWRVEAAEGFRWLWHNELLRTLAITLERLVERHVELGATLAREGSSRDPSEFAKLSKEYSDLAPVVEKIAQDIARVLDAPDLREWLTLEAALARRGAGGGTAPANVTHRLRGL